MNEISFDGIFMQIGCPSIKPRNKKKKNNNNNNNNNKLRYKEKRRK